MLYWLLYQKGFVVFHIGPFRIFRYLTFRTAFASLTALFIGLVIGPAVVRRLRDFQIGQYIREDGPQAHQRKAGTPTMGGVLIVVAMVVPTLLWADLSNRFVWIAVVATLAYGAIGFADDYLKVVHRRNLGLTGRAKLFYQFLTALAIGLTLIALQHYGLYSTRLIVPFFKHFRPDLVIGRLLHTEFWPLAFLPFLIFVMIVIVGSSNSCLISTATVPIAPPSAKEPTSPMKTSAGWALYQRNPMAEPTMEPQKMVSSETWGILEISR